MGAPAPGEPGELGTKGEAGEEGTRGEAGERARGRA